jgi:itaconate CoA-transferase
LLSSPILLFDRDHPSAPTRAAAAGARSGLEAVSSGGQLDFVRGAYASKGGKSIIAARSTAAKGKVSRIVPRLDGPVTTPRIDTQYIVTEFGAVNLKGLSSTERALKLIELAHPEFRDELTEAAKRLHLI